MLALNGHYWIQKCLSPRSAVAVLTATCKVTGSIPYGPETMSLRRTFPFQRVLVTNVHTSGGQCRDLMKKMFTNKRKKKWYGSSESVLTGQFGFIKPAKKRNPEASLRVRTLNTVLYKAISDLLSSHEINEQIPSYNVEITKVSLVADYSLCRIYWKASSSPEGDGQIQQILDKSSPRIRYLLISQQILGSVPPLVFVLDKQYAALKEVENLLKIADYGPSDDSEKLYPNEKDAQTTMHTEEKKRVMFGIDHDALYKQIEDYKQQSRDCRPQISSSASLTQEQLDMLAEIREQKLIEKRKRKAEKIKDDDITPREFLLMRQLQKEQDEREAEDGQGSERT